MAAQLLLSLACLFVPAMLGFSSPSFTFTFKPYRREWHAHLQQIPLCDKAISEGMFCKLNSTECRPGSGYTNSNTTNCQLNLTALCHNQVYQERQNSSNYTDDDVEKVSTITLKFPYDGPESNLYKVQIAMPKWQKRVCIHVWKEDPQSMQQGPVLQCNETGMYQNQETFYTCTFGNWSMCRNACDSPNDSVSASPPVTPAEDSDDIIALASVMTTVFLLLLLGTLAMMIAMAQKKCRKYISNKSLMPVGTCVSIISCILLRSKQSKEERTERMTPAAPVDAEPSRQADTKSTCSSQYALSHLPDCTVTSQHANEYRGSATGDEWEIPRSEIDVGVELSQGSYDQVFRGKLKLTAKSPNMDAHRKLMEFEGKPCLTIAVKM